MIDIPEWDPDRDDDPDIDWLEIICSVLNIKGLERPEWG